MMWGRYSRLLANKIKNKTKNKQKKNTQKHLHSGMIERRTYRREKEKKALTTHLMMMNDS